MLLGDYEAQVVGVVALEDSKGLCHGYFRQK
jgi:hypothetical protein